MAVRVRPYLDFDVDGTDNDHNTFVDGNKINISNVFGYREQVNFEYDHVMDSYEEGSETFRD